MQLDREGTSSKTVAAQTVPQSHRELDRASLKGSAGVRPEGVGGGGGILKHRNISKLKSVSFSVTLGVFLHFVAKIFKVLCFPLFELWPPQSSAADYL